MALSTGTVSSVMSGANPSGGTAVTFSHTTSTGTVLVFIGAKNTGNLDDPTVTYGGTTVNKITSDLRSTSPNVSGWVGVITGETAGTKTVSVTFSSGTQRVYIVAIDIDDFGSVKNSANSYSVFTTGSSVSIGDVAAGDLVVAAVYGTWGSFVPYTPPSGFTSLDESTSGSSSTSGISGEVSARLYSSAATGETLTMSGDGQNGNFLAVAVVLSPPVSSTNYDESISESFTPSDTVTSTLDAQASVTETMTVTESLASLLAAAASITESTSLSDTASGGIDFPESISEGLTVAETVAAQLGAVASVTEALTVTESLSSLLAAAASITETMTLTDTADGEIPQAGDSDPMWNDPLDRPMWSVWDYTPIRWSSNTITVPAGILTLQPTHTGDLDFYYTPNGATERQLYRSPVYVPAGPLTVDIDGDADQTSPVEVTVSGLKVVMDLPDVFESFNDVAISSSGTRLPITKTYQAITHVSVTVQNVATTVQTLILDRNPTLGPLIKIINSSNTGLSVTVDAIIKGF